MTLTGKGNQRHTIGLHFRAADTIKVYLEKSELSRGFLFRPRQNSRSKRLSDAGFSSRVMHSLLNSYLARLPEAMVDKEGSDGTTRQVCLYTPHSLRATTATLLLDAGEDIKKVQELLRHKHVTTTQIYDKRRFRTAEGASHSVLL